MGHYGESYKADEKEYKRRQHESNIRSWQAKLQKVADMYTQLVTLSEKQDSELAPLLDKAGQAVCASLSNSAVLLECLFVGMKVDDKKEMKISQRDLYYLAHCRCPSCGLSEIETTCIGYIIEDATTAIDGNQASCACGWKGIVHDLVPPKIKKSEA